MKKTILLTGGTRGIGAAIAQLLLDASHRVITCGRTGNYDGPAEYIPCDIGDPASRQALVECAGDVDVLINNAGIAPEARLDLLDTTEASFDRVMNVNLKGPFFLTQLVARRMAAAPRPGQMIVNIGSVSATVASVSRGEYCLSKAGVAMATQLWAVRLAEYGIPVYEIRPGVIRTDMTREVTAKYDRLIAGGLTLQRRWGSPEDVARAVKMLVDEALPYSTGQVIQVDGGMCVERL